MWKKFKYMDFGKREVSKAKKRFKKFLAFKLAPALLASSLAFSPSYSQAPLNSTPSMSKINYNFYRKEHYVPAKKAFEEYALFLSKNNYPFFERRFPIKYLSILQGSSKAVVVSWLPFLTFQSLQINNPSYLEKLMKDYENKLKKELEVYGIYATIHFTNPLVPEVKVEVPYFLTKDVLDLTKKLSYLTTIRFLRENVLDNEEILGIVDENAKNELSSIKEYLDKAIYIDSEKLNSNFHLLANPTRVVIELIPPSLGHSKVIFNVDFDPRSTTGKVFREARFVLSNEEYEELLNSIKKGSYTLDFSLVDKNFSLYKFELNLSTKKLILSVPIYFDRRRVKLITVDEEVIVKRRS